MPGSAWLMKTDGTSRLPRAGTRDHLAARAHAGLHEGEAAEPGQVDLLVDQHLDRRGVVGHGRELDLHAQLLLQVGFISGAALRASSVATRRGWRDAEHLLRMRNATEGDQRAGQQRTQGAGRGGVDHVVAPGGGLRVGAANSSGLAPAPQDPPGYPSGVAQVLLRRARLAPVRRHHRTRRVLPHPHRGAIFAQHGPRSPPPRWARGTARCWSTWAPATAPRPPGCSAAGAAALRGGGHLGGLPARVAGQPAAPSTRRCEMAGVGLDFSAGCAARRLVDGPALVFYPGSSIGNFAPPRRCACCARRVRRRPAARC
jgi:hypothetical protein